MLANKKVVVLGGNPKPSLDLIFAVNPAVPAGMTATRTTVATCLAYAPTAVAGDLPLVTPCAINEARFQNARRLSQGVWSNVLNDGSAIPLPITLLCEEARTNTIKHNAVNSTGWAGSTYTTVTANTYIAPNGATEMGQVLAKSGNNFHLARQSNVVITAGINTVSGYFRYVNNRWAGLQIYDGTNAAFACFDLLNGVVGSRSAGATASTLTATTQANVYKFTITTVALNSVSNGMFDIELRTADGTGTGSWTAAGTECFGAWGIQVEPAINASSTILTTTAAVTRTADVPSFTGAGLSWYNTAQGLFAITASGTAFNAPYNLGALALTYATPTKYLLGYNKSIKSGSTYLYTAATFANPTEFTGVSDPATIYVNSAGIANISRFTYYPKALKPSKMAALL
jgi:hypothetical protein